MVVVAHLWARVRLRVRVQELVRTHVGAIARSEVAKPTCKWFVIRVRALVDAEALLGPTNCTTSEADMGTTVRGASRWAAAVCRGLSTLSRHCSNCKAPQARGAVGCSDALLADGWETSLALPPSLLLLADVTGALPPSSTSFLLFLLYSLVFLLSSCLPSPRVPSALHHCIPPLPSRYP